MERLRQWLDERECSGSGLFVNFVTFVIMPLAAAVIVGAALWCHANPCENIRLKAYHCAESCVENGGGGDCRSDCDQLYRVAEKCGGKP